MGNGHGVYRRLVDIMDGPLNLPGSGVPNFNGSAFRTRNQVVVPHSEQLPHPVRVRLYFFGLLARLHLEHSDSKISPTAGHQSISQAHQV